MRPETVIEPDAGSACPAINERSVDLPEPLRPINPNVEPSGTSKLTSRTAQNSSAIDVRPRMMADFRVWLRS